MGQKFQKIVTMVTRKSQKWYFCPKKKKKNNLGATDLKLSMHIKLYSGSNMGWVPCDSPLPFLCKAKNVKNVISARILEPKELDL